MPNPRITVYIASHNYGRFLGDAVESVLRQTVDGWELLIIDDGSTDNTSEVMKLYETDPRVRIFKTDGIGLPGVCNLALGEARGEMLIRLDGDDIFDENILLVLSNYLDRKPNCAMVFPDYYLMDEYGRVFGQERREKVYVENHLLDVPANGACFLIRKRVLEDLGGYREDLGAQDGFDIWIRLIKNCNVGNVNLPLFYYRQHDHNLTKNKRHIFFARQRIKLDAVRDSLSKFRPIIAIIPCRERYDFTPNLWDRKLNGESLLTFDIKKSIRSSIFDYIVVASDTPEVKTSLQLFDDNRIYYYQRKTENTVRSASLTPTIEGLLKEIDPDYNGLTVISYLQAPFVKTETMEEAIATVILNNITSAMGVEEAKERHFIRTAHGLKPINPYHNFTSDFDRLYREANTAVAFLNRNIKNGSIMGSQMGYFVVSKDECFFINSEQTLRIAEILL